jgi:DNA mismatch repair protein MutL
MTEPARRSRTPIRPLPERLINKIAAGEVVERPSAVVKELVENAIDAGATRIEIMIEKSGTKLIRIVDNGWGIPEDQIEIAFSRHATSKISSFSDLDRIVSYGFRGEALPSIASVSRMRMVSRTAEAASASEIIYEGGVLQTRRPVAGPPGTTVEVENLFYNTPARRKFLKAESTEARHISRVATALALGRPDIGFSYNLNGRTIFNLPPGQDLAARVAGVLGLKGKLASVYGRSDAVEVLGFIGHPDTATNNRWGHFIFINGRFIQSPTLSHAISAGYGELLPRGLFPVGALLLTVEPTEVDVNVHPAKTEVRLARERELYATIMDQVKRALSQDGIIPVFASREPGQMYRPADRPGVIPGIGSHPLVTQEQLTDLYRPPSSALHPPTAVVRVDTETGEILDPEPPATGSGSPSVPTSPGPSAGIRLVGRFSDLYLLLQAGDDLFIVDQHTAHERVLYEEMVRRIDSHSVVGQQLLLPVQIELTPEQFGLFGEAGELLNQSGFTVSEFGGRTVNIEALPSVLSRKSPEKLFLKVLDDLASLRKGGQDLKKSMAQSIACRAAVMSGDRLNDQEAVALLEQLLRCENKYSCPHGRPTFVKISRSDLDRQFGRG